MWNVGVRKVAWSPGVSLEVLSLSSSGRGTGWQSCGEGKRGKLRTENGRMELRGSGGVLGGPGVSESYVPTVRTPATPHFISCLLKKLRLNWLADRYKPALYGFHGLDRAVWTVAGGLRVHFGDTLRSRQGKLITLLCLD